MQICQLFIVPMNYTNITDLQLQALYPYGTSPGITWKQTPSCTTPQHPTIYFQLWLIWLEDTRLYILFLIVPIPFPQLQLNLDPLEHKEYYVTQVRGGWYIWNTRCKDVNKTAILASWKGSIVGQICVTLIND